jgi:hypothetical protein
MFYLACTRFNNITYDENIIYRKKEKETVIYGSTLKIREIYPYGSLLFVAEMNNEKNRIEGIGLIKNLLVHDKRHRIYDNSEYNRYIYRGKYWLSREQINDFDPEILEIFDNILFKGKSHLKCRIGITVITEKIFVHWAYDLKTLKHKVKELFLYNFKYNIGELDIELKEDKEDKEDKDIEHKEEPVYFDIIPKKRKREEIKNTDINIEI